MVDPGVSERFLDSAGPVERETSTCSTSGGGEGGSGRKSGSSSSSDAGTSSVMFVASGRGLEGYKKFELEKEIREKRTHLRLRLSRAGR